MHAFDRRTDRQISHRYSVLMFHNIINTAVFTIWRVRCTSSVSIISQHWMMKQQPAVRNIRHITLERTDGRPIKLSRVLSRVRRITPEWRLPHSLHRFCQKSDSFLRGAMYSLQPGIRGVRLPVSILLLTMLASWQTDKLHRLHNLIHPWLMHTVIHRPFVAYP